MELFVYANTTTMHHPSKKQRLTVMETDSAEATVADQIVVTSGDLSVDVLANIFGFLDGMQDIMQKRCVCKKWKEAVKQTTSPLVEFHVNSMEKYNAMVVMTRAMPNLQQIMIGKLGPFVHWSDGEDPNEGLAARFANWTTRDIEIISNFSKLRILEINASLNGRYPFLFNSFPLLQKLSLSCYSLKWDLEMLAGLPILKELDCGENRHLNGNINSLRVLKDTLEKVEIRHCSRVEGNFMDLADFPHLKVLNLAWSAVKGDIRDIGDNDFSSLEELILPNDVYGGWDYQLQRISDGPDLMRALYLFNKQRPNVIQQLHSTYWKLSEDSPDWYESVEVDENDDSPPIFISFVEAGSRVGYQWETYNDIPCEVNWLDPEPDKERSDYGKYIEELQEIERDVNRSMYRGFHQPPTEEEYIRLHDV